MARDAFARSVAVGWGTADVGGAWQHRLNGTNADASASASVDGARGRLAVATTSGPRVVLGTLGPATADADLRVTGRADRAGTTSGAWLILAARAADANRFYAAQINLMSNSFAIRHFRNGVWTTLGSGPTPSPAFAANTDYTIRFQLQGTSLKAKWWRAGQPEPAAWAVQVTDATYASGQSGVAGVVAVASSTVNFSYDDFQVSPLAGDAAASSAKSASAPAGASVTGASAPADAPSAGAPTAVEQGTRLAGDALRGLSELWQRIRP
jgi:hypothetical protein